MQSSPSSQGSSEEMFPSASTPQAATQSQSMNAAELSPPNSQSRSQVTGSMDEFMTNAPQPPRHTMTQDSFSSDFNVTGAGSTENMDTETNLEEKQPGWAWKNPKALEDRQRALEMCLDRGFSLSIPPAWPFV